MSKNRIIVIIGQTASGKSDLGVFLAKKFSGEVISADSRQVYRGLTIGSGKISKQEMRGVPHHLLDVADPRRIFSVAQYQKLAEKALHEIIARKKIPIIVGGSGMYLDAILFGAPYPSVPPNKKLRKLLEKKSANALFLMLQKRDSARAHSIDRHNKRRLIRALEIFIATKKPIPPLVKIHRYNPLIIGITKDMRALNRRIDIRLKTRIRHGLIAEVRRLLAKGVSYKRLYELGLEYRFISEYIRGARTKKETLALLSRAIKKFAKRQMTWFMQYQKTPKIHWIRTKKQAEKPVARFFK
ncbi:MAG: tRNA (adenosine(37)-N6)-dimethylallyltransferase MiaA [Patescibacteria group bacterium]